MVLFVANYPDSETIKEGMSQRIFAIDKQFENENRSYVFISHRAFWRKEVVEVKKGVKQYRCNLFVHIFFLMSLFSKAKIVYFHSMMNAFWGFPLFYLGVKKGKYVLDVHGIVPEEQKMNGNLFKCKTYNFVEKRLFKILDYAIVVTEQMKTFYTEKYPFSKDRLKYIIYPIISDNIIDSFEKEIDIEQKSEKIEVIYSGNTQSWQNIPMMINLIKNNISDKINYTILTGDIEGMLRLFKEQDIDIQQYRITVISVSPNELSEYYQKAHYGFVLRDDIDVNKVACPTKMLEYLRYGIVPVVKLKEIGDFGNFGYDYIGLSEFDKDLISVNKSQKNIKIAEDIVRKFKNTNIQHILKY